MNPGCPSLNGGLFEISLAVSPLNSHLRTKLSSIENVELSHVLLKDVKTSPPFKLLWSCDIDEYMPSRDPYSGLKACLR